MVIKEKITEFPLILSKLCSFKKRSPDFEKIDFIWY